MAVETKVGHGHKQLVRLALMATFAHPRRIRAVLNILGLTGGSAGYIPADCADDCQRPAVAVTRHFSFGNRNTVEEEAQYAVASMSFTSENTGCQEGENAEYDQLPFHV